MKKFFRFIFVFILIIIIFISAGFISIKYFITEEVVINKITSIIESRYNLSLKYKGAGISLLKGIYFSSITAVYQKSCLVSADSLSLSFDLSVKNIFKNGVKLNTLSLTRPVIKYDQKLEMFLKDIETDKKELKQNSIKDKLGEYLSKSISDLRIIVSDCTFIMSGEKYFISRGSIKGEYINISLDYLGNPIKIYGNYRNKIYNLSGTFTQDDLPVDKVAFFVQVKQLGRAVFKLNQIKAELFLSERPMNLPVLIKAVGSGLLNGDNLNLDLQAESAEGKSEFDFDGSVFYNTHSKFYSIGVRFLGISGLKYDFIDAGFLDFKGKITGKNISGNLKGQDITLSYSFLNNNIKIDQLKEIIITNDLIQVKNQKVKYLENEYTASIRTSLPLSSILLTVEGDYFSYDYLNITNKTVNSTAGKISSKRHNNTSLKIKILSEMKTVDFLNYKMNNAKVSLNYDTNIFLIKHVESEFKGKPLFFNGYYNEEKEYFSGKVTIDNFQLSNLLDMDLEDYISDDISISGDSKVTINVAYTNYLILDYNIDAQNIYLDNFFLQKMIWENRMLFRKKVAEDLYPTAEARIIYTDFEMRIEKMKLASYSFNYDIRGVYSNENNYYFDALFLCTDKFKELELRSASYVLFKKTNDLNFVHIIRDTVNGKSKHIFVK